MLRENRRCHRICPAPPVPWLVTLLLMLLAGCAGESDELIRRKLDVILADDLASVVMEMPAAGVCDSPYYRITDYRRFTKGPYPALAVVDFHFLKGDVARMVRKYRYHKWQGQWERYVNEYRLVQDSLRPDAIP